MSSTRKYLIRNKSNGRFLNKEVSSKYVYDTNSMFGFITSRLIIAHKLKWVNDKRYYDLLDIENIIKDDIENTNKKLKNAEIIAVDYCEVPTTVKLEKMIDRISQKELIKKLKRSNNDNSMV